MLTKRTIIVALVGVNLFLLASLFFSSYRLPAAYAQRIGAGSNYIGVTCEADEDYDLLYVLDLPQRKLHAFIPSRTLDGNIELVANRNLESDFRRGK